MDHTVIEVTLHWGTFRTESPLVQTTPNGLHEVTDSATKEIVKVNKARRWALGEAQVPVISGDSIRGALRRTLAYHIVEAVGLARGDVALSVGQLLVAGGALGNRKPTLTDELLANHRHLVPPLALLGGTHLGVFTQGRLMAGAWVAQVQETPAPALYVDGDNLPKAQDVLVTEHFAKRGMTDSQQWKPDGVGDASTRTSISARSEESDRTGNSPMPFAYEAVVPGVVFAGWVALRDYRGLTPEDDTVQRACLRFGLEETFHPGHKTVIGLRGSCGYGVVSFDWDLSALAESTAPYLDFLAKHKDEIARLLSSEEMVPVLDTERMEERSRRNAENRARREAARARRSREANTTSEPVESAEDDDSQDDSDIDVAQ